MFLAKQIRRHHRRQDKRDHAGNENRARQSECEFAEQRAREPALERDRRVHRRERDRHRDSRPNQFSRANQRRVHPRQARAHVALDVFDDNDRVVHDQSDRKHNGEQRKQIQREAEHLHQKERADQRYRNRDDGNDHGPKRSQEQKDDEHHDQQRVDERFYDFVNRVVDVSSCVISNFGLHTARQFFFDLLKLSAHSLNHIDRVRIWQNVNAHEDRFLAGEAHFGVVILGAEHDVGDIADSNECAFVLFDYELFELFRRV